MANSTNLALPYLAAGQAQKHVTVNESLQRLDAIVQLSVASATTIAQPGSPSDGQVYILPSGKTGAAWGAMTNAALAYYRDGVWEEISPREGWIAFVKDVDQCYFYTGSAWSALPALAKANSFSAGQTIAITSGTTALTLRLTDDGAGTGPYLVLDRVSASPAANDVVGSLYFQGRDSGGTAFSVGEIRGQIIDPSDGSEDSRISFHTMTAGANSGRLRIDAGLYHPSATGGDKGDNTINYGAVYDDNTLLTCFVLEYANTGALDLEFWDGLSPSGRHDAAHRFWAARDLLSLDAYAQYWRANGHLPGMPSRAEWADHARDKKPIGDMVSRLWQTVEMQAVHIAELDERLARLEARCDAP